MDKIQVLQETHEGSRKRPCRNEKKASTEMKEEICECGHDSNSHYYCGEYGCTVLLYDKDGHITTYCPCEIFKIKEGRR